MLTLHLRDFCRALRNRPTSPSLTPTTLELPSLSRMTGTLRRRSTASSRMVRCFACAFRSARETNLLRLHFRDRAALRESHRHLATRKLHHPGQQRELSQCSTCWLSAELMGSAGTICSPSPFPPSSLTDAYKCRTHVRQSQTSSHTTMSQRECSRCYGRLLSPELTSLDSLLSLLSLGTVSTLDGPSRTTSITTGTCCSSTDSMARSSLGYTCGTARPRCFPPSSSGRLPRTRRTRRNVARLVGA